VLQVPVFPQTPFAPHALLQQTPITQLPLVHWVLMVQAIPLLSGETQLPLMQTRPEAQSAVVPHVVGQPVVLHA
jgi:hypothetical protein